MAKRENGEPRSDRGRPADAQNPFTAEEYANRIAERLRRLREGGPPPASPELTRQASGAVEVGHEPGMAAFASDEERVDIERLAPEPVGREQSAPAVEVEGDERSGEWGPATEALADPVERFLAATELRAAEPAGRDEPPAPRPSIPASAPASDSAPLESAPDSAPVESAPVESAPESAPFEPPPGPSPRPVRSPTARHWSRPTWQDAATASGEAIRAPEPDRERQDAGTRRLDLRTGYPNLRPPINRRGLNPTRPPESTVRSTGPGCRYLGLGEDRSTHFTFPHPGHLCFGLARPGTINEGFQASHCLTDGFLRCRRFVAGEERAGRVPVSAGDPLSPAELEMPVSIPVDRLAGGVAQARSRAVRLLFGLIVVLLALAATAGLLGALPAGLAPGGAEERPAGRGTPGPSAGATATAMLGGSKAA